MANYTVELTEVNSTGFKLTTRDAAAAAVYVGFMLFGGEENASVDTTEAPASTGTKSWEGPGFKPDFIMVLQTGLDAFQTGTSYYTNEHLWYSVGIAATGQAGCAGVLSVAAAGTMVCYSRQASDIIAGPRTSYSDDIIATFSSFDSLGYNFYYYNVDSGAPGDIGFTLALQFEPPVSDGVLFFGAGV